MYVYDGDGKRYIKKRLPVRWKLVAYSLVSDREKYPHDISRLRMVQK